MMSATDHSAFAACPHLNGGDVVVARGPLDRPHRFDPASETLIERGQKHNRAFVERVRAQRGTAPDLAHAADRVAASASWCRALSRVTAGTATRTFRCA